MDIIIRIRDIKYLNSKLTTGRVSPLEKYYDKYLYISNNTNYTNRILGDATREMVPFQNANYANNVTYPINSWHSGMSYHVYSANPWIDRSGSYEMGLGSSIFTFSNDYGSVRAHVGFRVILTP